MKALIQRVTQASVEIDDECVGAIDEGLMLLLGIERHDTPELADKLCDKVMAYRIFPDDAGRMNRSLKDINGGMLVVSQFTLVADTSKGTRPGFSKGATPEHGKALYDYFVAQSKQHLAQVQSGRFGADMRVSLVNNGPVTFMLEV